MVTRKLTQVEKEYMVAEWNELYPIGKEVIVTDDDGNEHETVTIGEAGMLGGHTPVISTEWKRCYHLSRVKAV